jgi:hypothetical protein
MYKAKLKDLIIESGGEISDDLFVEKVGVKIIKSTELDMDFMSKFINAKSDNLPNDYLISGKFNAQLCYLAFNKEKEDKPIEFCRKMIQYGHLSVWNDFYVTFMIAGASDETIKEFLAHNESTCNRLTSSNTKSQIDTFYRIQGEKHQRYIQKKFITEFVEMRNRWKDELGAIEWLTYEYFNLQNLGSKAGAFVYTMNLKDFKKMIKGRLPQFGNESEVREIVKMMLCQLTEKYGEIFKDSDSV